MELNKVRLSFEYLPVYDPKTMLLVCTSDWSFIKDKPAIVEITPPGSSRPIVEYWGKNEVNKFDSSNLLLTCGATGYSDLIPIPDGIYHIKIKGSPDTFNYESYISFDSNLQLEIDKEYSKLSIDIEAEDRNFVNSLWNTKMLLEASRVSIRRGEIKKTVEYYKEAERLVKSLNRC